MFDTQWQTILEVVARVSIIYIGCMVLLRVSGRREMSEMGPMDLLAMLLISETVSPAMTGGDESVPVGLVAAGTLISLVVLTSFLTFKSRKAETILQGHAVVLVHNGRVDRKVMNEFRISDDDLRTSLHQHGLLHVREVARAFVEPDGKITMIKTKDVEESPVLHRSDSARERDRSGPRA